MSKSASLAKGIIEGIGAVSPENMTFLNHPDTIDLWIVQEGSGTVITGGETVNGVHQGGTEGDQPHCSQPGRLAG